MSSRKTIPGKSLPSSMSSSPTDFGSPIMKSASSATSPSSLSPETSHIFHSHNPIPDNYGYIKSCSHITSVLDSKARDNVLITYRQAVGIAMTSTDIYNNHKIYRLKKDGSSVPSSKLQDLKLKSLKCSDCTLNSFFHNFICLQCPHVGCFNNSNHAHQHYKLNQHLFAIDSFNGLLYCFSCGDYINNPSLEQIRSGMISGDSHPETPSQHLDGKMNLMENPESHYITPSKQAVTGLKGFVNLGSTCFMSCILQSFIHNPILKFQFFNNDFHYFNCDSNLDYVNGSGGIDANNACITCSIDNIFKGIFTANDSGGFGMTNLLMTAWYKKKSLAGFQEQDAHEFWQFLLNEFHSDYEKINQKLNSHNHNDDMNGTGNDSHHCKCITHTTFSGELQSAIRCLNCDSITKTIDPLIDLSLEINQLRATNETATVYDCLDLFTKDEKLDVMYGCQNCGTKAAATKSLKIKKLAPVLSIQLKRFEHNLFNDSSSKLEIPVKTPLFLNLTKYTSDFDELQFEPSDPTHSGKDSFIDQDKVYELFTVVSHIGSVNTGHYVVMVKQGDGRWFKFDDSVISIVSQQEVMDTNAYLLFYITHRI